MKGTDKILQLFARKMLLIWTTTTTSLDALRRRIHDRQRELIQGRVQPLFVVKRNEARQPGLQGAGRAVVVKVNIFVLQGPPQPLHEHVVHPAAATVHADRHARRFQTTGKRHGRVLHALVGVENFRLAKFANASSNASRQNWPSNVSNVLK